MAKSKQTFDLKKLSKKLDKIYVDGLNTLGRHLDKALQDNIKAGGDPTFEPLSPVTKRLGGKKPLNRSGKMMKAVNKTPATKSKQVFKLTIKSKYGGLHHTGYTTDPKSMIPNKKVPARKWFMIPKSIQPGGAELEKVMTNIRMQIRSAWKKI